MSSQEHIVIITPIYPSSDRPELGTFTRLKARNLVRLGLNVTVIHPTKFWKPDAGVSTEQINSGGVVEPAVRRPAYMTFSGKYIPVLGSTFRWTMITFERAVRRAIRDLSIRPTHLYGQFLFPAGYAAARLSREIGAKSIVDIGETYFHWYEKHLGIDNVKRVFNEFDSIITVADHLRKLCIDSYDVSEDNIASFRNAAGPEFKPADGEQARAKLGLPNNLSIVGFIGTLYARKRPLYVLDAIRDRPDIGVFFLGHADSDPPGGDQVLFAGAVPHEQVPLWLSAADVYVHASLNEGTSNAIAEAVACGVPVVATDIPGNRELLHPDYSILVDPLDQDAMSRAIFKIIDSPKLQSRMSIAALESARSYTGLDRMRRILDWLRSN